MKKVAILQSNYLPWKGYFDLIAYVDEFIIYDDMQYTNRDWRNRNMIKTPNGLLWLSIPVGTNTKRTIREVLISEKDWRNKHCQNLKSNYQKSPFFDEVYLIISDIILDDNINSLSELNISLINAICNYLHIETKISYCWDYGLIDGKTERLVDLCQKANASVYVSGPSAKNYIDEQLFKSKNIQLEWFNYEGYQEYPQLWGDFTHSVSILDLLFNCGKYAYKYMRYVHD